MQDLIQVTGMILKQTPIGEYDRRICLLTKEKGKISAFVRGSRKPGSRLSNATNPFSFGVFKLHVGKNAYNVQEADIQNYFEDLRTDYIGAYYGMYFAEIADYYTEAFFNDFKLVNNRMPEIVSKATDNIDEYIKIISTLIDKDYAENLKDSK